MIKAKMCIIFSLASLGLTFSSIGSSMASVNPHLSCILPLSCESKNSYYLWDEKIISLSWGNIWKWLKPKRGKGVRRHENKHQQDKIISCMIIPGTLNELKKNSETPGEPEKYVKTSVEIWNPRPLFLWQNGNWKWIRVYDNDGWKLLWTKELKLGQRSVFYDKEVDPLIPNKNGYTWELISEDNGDNRIRPQKIFRIIKAEKSQQIKRELQELMNNWDNLSSSSSTRIKNRVNFFIKKQLAGDVLREIYASPKESKQIIEQIEGKDFCSPINHK